MVEKKNVLIYPIILHPEDKGYSVEIPDVAGGIWTQGEDMKDAVIMAEDAIGIALADQNEFPEPSELTDIESKTDEIKILVTVDIEEYRRNNPKTIRKNVTVPEYLVKLGKENGINFSQVLTEALKNKLDI
ncbi:hypothetical protein ABM34_05865 [Companilactobacillus ginsenosidimutans]|uniref:HicB-like antitoxin of toxin-antitoxin system domain-containing protein n=2 Tax=Companilactobacillus ginsenosidimutans TaxID=1007676 RepID=A0A0H4R3S1_9LACO|nr:hypothetical protein ABM34_05865 [Companilactobacillus ginsenosidimutans]